MKKYTGILILLLVPFLLTACIPGKKVQPKPMTVEDETIEEKSQKTTFTGKLKDLMSSGNAMMCTAKYSGEDGDVEITVYTQGEKAYTEMKITAPEMGTINQRSIMDGEWMYTWDPETKTGTKMSLAYFENAATEEETEDTEEMEEDVNMDKYQQDFDYECESWNPEPRFFEAPDDVEFTDMTEAVQKMQESVENMDMEGMKESACDACNMLPAGTDRDECLVDLGC